MINREAISPARRIAQRVLLRVARDRAYGVRALDSELGRQRLTDRDRALATELVYGTLRHLPRLDFVLQAFARRPLAKLPPEALAALQLGAYQILETRIPAHSAVNESVALTRERHPRLGSVTNAILRKVAAGHDAGTLPDPAERFQDPVEALSVSSSHPAWLLRRLARRLDFDTVRAFAEANNTAPPVGIRVNPRRATRDAVAERLRQAGVDVQVLDALPGALCLRGAGPIADLPGHAQGEITVQDPAAQLVGLMASPEPGSVVLDACAAPGGKATHLAEMMQDRGMVLATDLHHGKSRLVSQAAQRLGLDCIEPACLDSTRAGDLLDLLGTKGVQAVDLAVVDAPCSGLGTLRRHPELRTRDEADLPALAELQSALLDAAATVVRPGGVLIYAVCTLTDEEGIEQLNVFLERREDFAPEAPEHAALTPFLYEYGGTAGMLLRTWPEPRELDGFFAVRLRRRS